MLPAAMLRVGEERMALGLLVWAWALLLLERPGLGPRLALLDGLTSRLGLRAAAAAAPDLPMQSWRDRFTQVGAISPILESEEKDVDDVTEVDDMGEDMGTDMGLGVGTAAALLPAPPRPPKAAATAASPSDAVRVFLVRLLALLRLLMLLISSSNPGWAGDGAAELGALSDVPNTFCGVLFWDDGFDDDGGWLGW